MYAFKFYCIQYLGKYLGVNILHNKLNCRYFQFIINKMDNVSIVGNLNAFVDTY